MIYYLVTEGFRDTIDLYLESRGAEVRKLFEIIPYEQWLSAPTLRPGMYIFSDLERLTPRECERAASTWRELATSQRNVWLLNHPILVRKRYELLRLLYERGTNSFNLYRLTEGREPQRYPVFIRNENNHEWLTEKLFRNDAQLAQGVQDLEARGVSREDLVVTEFCDVKDEHGVYRKYSAFFVGDTVIPRHLFFQNSWMVKRGELFEPERIEEELEYLRSNPHAEQIEEIFALARINYGRIDYGLLDGKLQVWEINTNPHIATIHDVGGEARVPAQEIFLKNFHATLRRHAARPAQEPLRNILRSSINLAGLGRYKKELARPIKAIEQFVRRS